MNAAIHIIEQFKCNLLMLKIIHILILVKKLMIKIINLKLVIISESMLLMIEMLKKLLEHFMRKNCK